MNTNGVHIGPIADKFDDVEEREPGEEGLLFFRGFLYALVLIVLGGLAWLSHWVGLL